MKNSLCKSLKKKRNSKLENLLLSSFRNLIDESDNSFDSTEKNIGNSLANIIQTKKSRKDREGSKSEVDTDKI